MVAAIEGAVVGAKSAYRRPLLACQVDVDFEGAVGGEVAPCDFVPCQQPVDGVDHVGVGAGVVDVAIGQQSRSRQLAAVPESQGDVEQGVAHATRRHGDGDAARRCILRNLGAPAAGVGAGQHGVVVQGRCLRHDAAIFDLLTDREVEGGRFVDHNRGVVEALDGFALGQDAEGLVGRHAERSARSQGEDVVVPFLSGRFGEPGVAVCTIRSIRSVGSIGSIGSILSILSIRAVCSIRAVRAADAVPCRAAVHAQVPGVVDYLSVVGLNGPCRRDVAAQQDLRRGGGGTVCTGLAFGTLGTFRTFRALRACGSVLPVGADGVVIGVGQELAVQCPVPVAVFSLRQAYLRRLTVGPLRTIIDGDGVGVPEVDGVAHRLAAFRHGADFGDHVRCVQQLLYGCDALVYLLLPGLEGGEACGLGGQFFGVLIDLLPEPGVIVLTGRQGQRGEQEKGWNLFCFHLFLDF